MTIPDDPEVVTTSIAHASHDEMWWPWFRLLLCVALILAVSQILVLLGTMGDVWSYISKVRSTGRMWLTPALLSDLLPTLGVPAATIIFSIGCLLRKRGAWLGLLISNWCELGFWTYQFGRTIFNGLPSVFSLIFWQYIPRQTDVMLHHMAIAGMVLYMLNRPQVKEIFSVSESKGFDVIRDPGNPVA